MGAEWNKWDWDYVWHALGGLAINGLLVVLPLAFFSHVIAHAWAIPFAVMLLVTAGGFVREKIQHDWESLSAHQFLEGALWGVGALVSASLGLIWLL
jgi:hypothetical protein